MLKSSSEQENRYVMQIYYVCKIVATITEIRDYFVIVILL